VHGTRLTLIPILLYMVHCRSH